MLSPSHRGLGPYDDEGAASRTGTVGFGCACVIFVSLVLSACGARSELPAPGPSDFPTVGQRASSRLALGDAHACAVRDGAVWCWGFGADSELGDGSTMSRATPAPVPGLTDAVQISAGLGVDAPGGGPVGSHTCAVLADGTVSCWGPNVDGQTNNGGGPVKIVPLPTPVAGVSDAFEVSAGQLDTCVRSRDGSVACWGLFTFADCTSSVSPVPIDGVTGAVGIAAGNPAPQCALDVGGSVQCWGADFDFTQFNPIFSFLTGCRSNPGVN